MDEQARREGSTGVAATRTQWRIREKKDNCEGCRR